MFEHCHVSSTEYPTKHLYVLLNKLKWPIWRQFDVNYQKKNGVESTRMVAFVLRNMWSFRAKFSYFNFNMEIPYLDNIKTINTILMFGRVCDENTNFHIFTQHSICIMINKYATSFNLFAMELLESSQEA